MDIAWPARLADSAGAVGACAPTGAHPPGWLLVGNTGCKVNLCCLVSKCSRESGAMQLLLWTELLRQHLSGLEQGERWCPTGQNTPVMLLQVTEVVC